MPLNNEWVNNEIKEEIQRYLQTHKSENTTAQMHGTYRKQPQRKIHSITGLSQETRKSSNKQTLH